MARLTIRLDFSAGGSLGPGKVALLEAIAETGSIRKAAIAVGMSFRQAWLLLRAVEDMHAEPLVETERGGSGGGGASLTELGREVIAHYRAAERLAEAAVASEMAAIERRLRGATHPPAASVPSPRMKRKSLKKK